MNTTPRQDGFRMPGEFEKQAGMWMLWPERNDNWRDGAKPAQEAFANVAKAIADFEPVLYACQLHSIRTAEQSCRIISAWWRWPTTMPGFATAAPHLS